MPKWVRIPFLGVPCTRLDWLKSLAFHSINESTPFCSGTKRLAEDTPGVGAPRLPG